MVKAKILAVDDSPTAIYDVKTKLENFEYSVLTAYNAQEAMRQIESEQPDVVILDNILPDMNGVDMLRLVRHRYPDTIFIIVTATDTKEVVTEALKSGADDYLSKPLNVEKLPEIINFNMSKKKILLKYTRLNAELAAKMEELNLKNKELDDDKIAMMSMLEDLENTRLKLQKNILETNNILTSMLDGLIVTDTDGIIRRVNPMAIELTGYTETELLGMSISSIIEELKDKSDFYNIIDSIRNVENTIIKKNGDKTPIIFSGSAMIDNDKIKQGMIFVAQDITNLKKMENELININHELEKSYKELQTKQHQLVLSEKLASIGQLSASLAHEFNNILGIIKGNCEYALENLHNEQELEHILKIIDKQVTRGVDVVKDLRLSAQPIAPEFTEINLLKLFNELGDFNKRNLIRNNINMHLEIPENIFIYADYEQMRQLFLNLIINSMQALAPKSGGEIKILCALDKENNNAVIEFSDNGIGMTSDVIENAFDPFFTTKDQPKENGMPGTGLGLYVVKNIVNNHNGSINLKSEPGEGVVFTIKIPLAAKTFNNDSASKTVTEIIEQPLSDKTRQNIKYKIPAKTRVMVCDDEEDILELLINELNSIGITNILQFSDGNKAIDFISSETFDLLILDLQLPGIDGQKLAQLAWQTNPNTPVLLITGVTNISKYKKEFESHKSKILKKPFSFEVFKQNVVELLNAKTTHIPVSIDADDKMRVLIVDDDEEQREMLTRLIKNDMYDIYTAENGRLAIDILTDNSIDVILSDINMPILDGIGLLKFVKLNYPEIYVILITGYANVDAAIEAVRFGAFDFIKKPYSPKEINMRLEFIKQQIKLKNQLKLKEQKLIHSHRLAAIGTLSAGLMHEINNPNTFIHGNIQFIQKCWKQLGDYFKFENVKDDTIRFILDEIIKALDSMNTGSTRISEIVNNVKSFAKYKIDDKDVVVSADVDLISCCNRAIELLNYKIKHFNIVKNFDIDNLTVKINETELIQVFVNVLNNAIDAVENIEKPSITVNISKKIGYANITFIDNGCGIPKKQLSRIMEPFFTTKTQGRGTGLGLSIILGIIKRYNGNISIGSEENKWTKVEISFPLGARN